MNVLRNKKTRALILVMCALALLGILIAKAYYGKINTSIDPRVIGARELYEKYNAYAQSNNFDSVFYLLDTIESIYFNQPHYKESFEVGVLYNNRAASYLTLALYSPVFSQDSASVDSLMALSEKAAVLSVSIYSNWLDNYKDKSEDEIRSIAFDSFTQNFSDGDSGEIAKFFENRIQEIQDAQLETPRRLSVTYTNLGIIFRHRNKYEEAANAYSKALELWEQNLTAENNLNVLLGKPMKKRTLIQKLFPPDRK